jgi:hypothetical protein
MNRRSAGLYVLLLIPSLLLMATMWTFAISGRLYYCWDSVPLLDFIPPFVHSASDARDHYVAPALIVWALWAAFLVGGFALPAWALQQFRASTSRAPGLTNQ